MSTTIIIKKRPPVFPLIKRLLCSSLCLVLVTQNIHMARATEHDALLEGGHEKVGINEVRVDIAPQIQNSQSLQETPPVQLEAALRNPITGVQYKPTILSPVNKDLAEKQFKALTHFIVCAHSPQNDEKIRAELLSELAKEEIKINPKEIDDREKLLTHLKGRALKALTNKRNLSVYLKELREQNEALILAINEFINKDTQLRERNEALLAALKQFIETDIRLREQNKTLHEIIASHTKEKNRAIQTLETRYKYHMAFLGVSGLLLSVGCFFLGHYVWTR